VGLGQIQDALQNRALSLSPSSKGRMVDKTGFAIFITD